MRFYDTDACAVCTFGKRRSHPLPSTTVFKRQKGSLAAHTRESDAEKEIGVILRTGVSPIGPRTVASRVSQSL